MRLYKTNDWVRLIPIVVLTINAPARQEIEESHGFFAPHGEHPGEDLQILLHHQDGQVKWVLVGRSHESSVRAFGFCHP